MMKDSSVEIDDYDYNYDYNYKYKRVLTLSMPHKENNNKRKMRKRKMRFNLRIKLKKRLCIGSAVARWLKSWRSLLGHALRSLFFNTRTTSTCYRRNRSGRNNSNSKGNSKEHRRQYSYCRSNSFYAEAIAECLEFIKRSSNANNDSHHSSSNNPLLRPQY